MSSSKKSRWTRVKAASRDYANGLYNELSTKNVFLFAQAFAFKVLVTVVPIVILLTGVLGNVLRYPEPFATVSGFVRTFLPAYESERLLEFLGAFQSSSSAFLSVGTVGLLVTAMTLATTVRLAVASSFEQDWNEQRSIVRGYIFDLRMVGQVGLLFLLTVVLSVLVQVLNAEGLALMNRLGLEGWLGAGWRAIFDVFSLLVPLMVSTAMFFQLFYFIPIPHPPRKSAFVGAFVTALLWELAKYGFALYATYIGTFNYQTASDGMTALTGGFGLIVAFVLWVYYSGIVLMVGAVIASLHEGRRRVRVRDDVTALPAGSKLEAAARQRPVAPQQQAPRRGEAPSENGSSENGSSENESSGNGSSGNGRFGHHASRRSQAPPRAGVVSSEEGVSSREDTRGR